MLKFTAWRALAVLPITLGVSIIVFITVKIVPGNPVDSILGPRPTPTARAAVEHAYGLDRSPFLQYFYWLGHVVRGDFGRSIALQAPARTPVVDAFGNTLILALFAFAVALVGGVTLGSLTVFAKHRWAKGLSRAVTLTALSTPQYTLGILFIVTLAARLGWFPTGGMRDVLTGGGLFHHLVLPGTAAGLVPMGIVARMFSSALAETASSGWVESLRARGLPRRRIRGQIAYGSLSPLLTISGLQLGYLLGGVVYIEVIFAWPGLGQLVFQSISRRDLPVIQAGVLISALAFVVLNFFVDVARAAVDPRIRRGRSVSA
jgi:peptide/nickel transport system permease protein